MNKQEFLEFSLSKDLNLWQSCKHWAVPVPDRVVTLTGIGDTDGKLPMQYNNEIAPTTIFYRLDGSTTGTDYITNVKPICHTLSDLGKEIEHKGEKFIPIIQLSAIEGILDAQAFADCLIPALKKDISEVPFRIVLKLIEWHFAVGLDKSEYVNVNELDINPYK